MITKKNILIFLFSFNLSLPFFICNTHIELFISSKDGTSGPILVYPGTYTPIKIKALVNSSIKYPFATISNYIFKNSELNDYLLFSSEDGQNIVLPLWDEVDFLIGLKCSTPVTSYMLTKTYTLSTSGKINDETDYSGSFSIKIGGTKSIIELTPLLTELTKDGYSYLKSKSKIFPTEDIQINCQPQAGNIYRGSFCDSLTISSGRRYDRYNARYNNFDSWNNLEIKYGSNGFALYDGEKPTYIYYLVPENQCIEIKQNKLTFTVNTETYIEQYYVEDKPKIVGSIKQLENTIPSTVKFQFDIPKAPAKIDCVSTMTLPYDDEKIISKEESNNEELSFYSNYFLNNGTVEIDLLLPIFGYDNHYFVKCLLGSARESGRNISLVFGDWLFTNYPQKLEIINPSVILPKKGSLIFNEEIKDETLKNKIYQIIFVNLIEEMNKDKPLVFPNDNGCFYTLGDITYYNKNFNFFLFNSDYKCKNSYKGNADQYFKQFMEKVDSTEEIQKLFGVNSISLKSSSYDFMEEIVNPGILTAAVESKVNDIITFSLYNPLNKEVNITYKAEPLYEDIYTAINLKDLKNNKKLTIPPKQKVYIKVQNIWPGEDNIISLIYATYNDYWVGTIFSETRLAIATINKNINALPYENNPKSKTDCSKPNDKIECINTKEKPFIEKLNYQDVFYGGFYYNNQGYEKIFSPQEKNYVIEKNLDLLNDDDIENGSNLLYLFYILKFLSSKDCHKENDYEECRLLKKKYFDRVINFVEPYFNCEKMVNSIKATADSNKSFLMKSEAMREGLTFYLLAITNLAKNPELFAEDTSLKIYNTYKCLKNRIFSFGYEYEYEVVDIRNLLESIPGYLTEAYQFDLLNGFVNEKEIIYKDSGIYVSNTTLKNKKIIEETIENQIGEKKFIDLGGAYTFINNKEEKYEMNNNIKSFPDTEIKVSIDSKKILEQYENAYYIESTIYYNYPLASQINSTICNSFIRFNLYDKSKKVIEAKKINEKPEILFPKKDNFKGCYYFDDLKNKLVLDGIPENRKIDGKDYSVCKVSHFTDFTIGNSKDVPAPDNEKDKEHNEYNYTNYLITAVLVLLIIIVFACTCKLVNKKRKKNDEKAIREQINNIEMS